MSSALSSVVSFYDYTLQPLPAFAAFGAPVSKLDVIGALRLALVMRQLREMLLKMHRAKVSSGEAVEQEEPRGTARDIATTLVMVYGGEAIVAPWLGIQPSFLVSPAYPVLFAGAQAVIELLPDVPMMSLATEIPFAPLDAATRAMLLCTIVPSMITTHASPAVATSPWALLVTSLIIANTGPFIANITSLLNPTPMRLTTPAEFLPAGWTATDLWAAPLVTALYATLTHAMPFFASLHVLFFDFFFSLGLGNLSFSDGSDTGVVAPLDADSARAACAVVLSLLFSMRAYRTFGVGLESPLLDVNPELEVKKREKDSELAMKVAGGGKKAAASNHIGKTKRQ
ncbi:hypothetical protein BV25DRAFT_1829461 [Artomyces pyxidatus]|uniref:Uncharacterized protein n=1 Tax=Artomyces pyxidatus TaxID=48021 RepID=A0ACB8ST52_9AGAM|nr:hypothetical protein BV25DRAFT_1829461 [Artomyces pyxidatus]